MIISRRINAGGFAIAYIRGNTVNNLEKLIRLARLKMSLRCANMWLMILFPPE